MTHDLAAPQVPYLVLLASTGVCLGRVLARSYDQALGAAIVLAAQSGHRPQRIRVVPFQLKSVQSRFSPPAGCPKGIIQ